jgi:hypothetical protein
MSASASKFVSATDTLREKFSKLCVVEENTKRDLAYAEQQLAAVRELKKKIGQQIFNQGGEPMVAGRRTAVTTSNNGPTHN